MTRNFSNYGINMPPIPKSQRPTQEKNKENQESIAVGPWTAPKRGGRNNGHGGLRTFETQGICTDIREWVLILLWIYN
jgi:hypothetical protein